MWAARCLKFNALATRMMMDVEFNKIGLLIAWASTETLPNASGSIEDDTTMSEI